MGRPLPQGDHFSRSSSAGVSTSAASSAAAAPFAAAANGLPAEVVYDPCGDGDGSSQGGGGSDCQPAQRQGSLLTMLVRRVAEPGEGGGGPSDASRQAFDARPAAGEHWDWMRV